MKYFGNVGYATTVETAPGVWEEQIIERPYYGDVNKMSRRLASSEHLNDNVDISNVISIVSDPFALSHFHSMRYVEWMGSKWKVSTVEVDFPRLNLTLGGLYNEQASY